MVAPGVTNPTLQAFLETSAQPDSLSIARRKPAA
jgi:hypothetical protein